MDFDNGRILPCFEIKLVVMVGNYSTLKQETSADNLVPYASLTFYLVN